MHPVCDPHLSDDLPFKQVNAEPPTLVTELDRFPHTVERFGWLVDHLESVLLQRVMGVFEFGSDGERETDVFGLVFQSMDRHRGPAQQVHVNWLWQPLVELSEKLLVASPPLNTAMSGNPVLFLQRGVFPSARYSDVHLVSRGDVTLDELVDPFNYLLDPVPRCDLQQFVFVDLLLFDE